MSVEQWQLIVLLALCAYTIRFAGLLAGEWIEKRESLRVLLDDLPGCLVVALVAASLADAETAAWVAALIALAIAIRHANVVLVMVAATVVFAVVRLVIT